MTPYTAVETLAVYAAVVLALIVLSLFLGALSGVVTMWLAKSDALARPPRTTSKERHEKLLKLISSTERERHH